MIKNQNIATYKKAAFITGSGKRIGAQIAKFLASKGYDVALHYNKSEKQAITLVKQLSKEFKINCIAVQSDLSDIDQVNNLGKKVLKSLPHLNLLINNASDFKESDILTIKPQQVAKDFNLHLITPLLLTQIFARNCSKLNIKGNIINLLDKNITRYKTKYSSYLLNKKILGEFTKMAALQLAPQVRVNAIAPDFICPSEDKNFAKWEIENLPGKNPLQKKVDIEHITKTIAYILDNDYINGQIMFVDGASALTNI